MTSTPTFNWTTTPSPQPSHHPGQPSIDGSKAPATSGLPNIPQLGQSPLEPDNAVGLLNATWSPSHPGVFQCIQTLGTRSSLGPASELAATIHENHSDWKVATIKPETVMFRGSNLGTFSKIQTITAVCGISFLSRGKTRSLSQYAYCLQQKSPQNTKICYPHRKYSQQHHKKLPSNTVFGPESTATTTRNFHKTQYLAQKVFSEAEIYFPKINIPFGPSRKNYVKFRQINSAVDGLPGWS